jgi:hypothetical protein
MSPERPRPDFQQVREALRQHDERHEAEDEAPPAPPAPPEEGEEREGGGDGSG